MGSSGGLPRAASAESLDEMAEPPPEWMEECVARAHWMKLGLDFAPFTVQAEAPMSLVHFYFSQLTLNCVFVVEKVPRTVREPSESLPRTSS